MHTECSTTDVKIRKFHEAVFDDMLLETLINRQVQYLIYDFSYKNGRAGTSSNINLFLELA